MSDGLPTRKKILELSGDMLKWQVYAIHTYPTDGLEAVMANTGPHLEYQHKMEEEGVYIAAGPHWADDEETWEGEGLIIVRAKNLADARRIAEERATKRFKEAKDNLQTKKTSLSKEKNFSSKLTVAR